VCVCLYVPYICIAYFRAVVQFAYACVVFVYLFYAAFCLLFCIVQIHTNCCCCCCSLFSACSRCFYCCCCCCCCPYRIHMYAKLCLDFAAWHKIFFHFVTLFFCKTKYFTISVQRRSCVWKCTLLCMYIFQLHAPCCMAIVITM